MKPESQGWRNFAPVQIHRDKRDTLKHFARKTGTSMSHIIELALEDIYKRFDDEGHFWLTTTTTTTTTTNKEE